MKKLLLFLGLISVVSCAKHSEDNPQIDSVAPKMPKTMPVTKNFDGIIDVTGYHPSDTHGAVGDKYVMSIANLASEVFDKNGTVISSPKADSVFFASLRSFGVPRRDGRLVFDPFANHWIFIVLYAQSIVGTAKGFFIAVSTTEDPTGSWNMWAMPTSMIDYPTLGFNNKWICIGNNRGSKLYVFDKTTLYNGGSELMPTIFSNFTGIWQPCVTLDANEDDLYLVKTDKGKNGTIGLAKITGSVDKPTIVTFPDAHAAYTWISPANLNYSQKGTTIPISSGSQDAMMNAEFINGTLWCTNGIGLTNPSRGCVAWWNINPEISSIIQYGEIQDNSGVNNYLTPTIAVNAQNKVLIGFSAVSKNSYPSAAYVLHTAGGIDSVHIYYNGTNFYNRTVNWGDYSNSCLDPIDNSLWTIQSYSGMKNDWMTRWADVRNF
jgi:hypothetical protein